MSSRHLRCNLLFHFFWSAQPYSVNFCAGFWSSSFGFDSFFLQLFFKTTCCSKMHSVSAQSEKELRTKSKDNLSCAPVKGSNKQSRETKSPRIILATFFHLKNRIGHVGILLSQKNWAELFFFVLGYKVEVSDETKAFLQPHEQKCLPRELLLLPISYVLLISCCLNSVFYDVPEAVVVAQL